MSWVCVYISISFSSLHTAWASPILSFIILPSHLYFSQYTLYLPAQILFLKHELFPRLVTLWHSVVSQSLYLCKPLNQSDEPEVLTKHFIR